MKLSLHKLWAGHFCLTLVVTKWRPWYAKFNERYARMDRFLELAIFDREFFDHIWRPL